MKERPILSVEDLEAWLTDLSELEACISEDACWRQIKMTCDTTDKSLEDAFTFFCMEIQPQMQPYATQKSLFPVVLELSASDALLLEEMVEDLANIGYEIEAFGQNSFIIQGIPADVLAGNEKNAIELLLEQFKHFSADLKFSKREKLIRCMARQMAIKAGQNLGQKEMHGLIESLSECDIPNTTASGAPTFIEFNEDYLDRLFSK